MPAVTELYLSLYEKIKTVRDTYTLSVEQYSVMQERDQAAIELRIENLHKQLENIEKYQEKVDYFCHLAEKHLTSKNLLPITSRELNFKRLSDWAMLIDPNEKDDPYAQRIYYLAKCNEKMLQTKRTEFQQTLCELTKEQPDSEALLEQKRKECRAQALQQMNEVLSSEEFEQFAAVLQEEHDKYCGSELAAGTLESEPLTSVGIGVYAQPFPVFQECSYLVKEKLKHYYDVQSSSILLPAVHPYHEESILTVYCSPAKEKRLYRGLQNLLQNLIRSIPIGDVQICLIDALHYNNSTLGALRPLEGTVAVSDIPKDSEQILDTLKQIVSSFPDIDEELGQMESVVEYNASPDCEKPLKRTILMLVGYPFAFSGEAKEYIKRILYNYEHYGISMILVDTQFAVCKEDFKPSLPVDVVQNVTCVQMTQRREMINQQGGRYYDFRWYEIQQELPADLIEEIKKKTTFSEVLGTEYIRRIDMENIPPYERGKKSIVLPYGVDQKDVVHSISFDNENFASYLVGASGSGKSTLLHTLITGILRDYHPDDVELWLADFKMSEFAQYIDPRPPHIKYILLDESPELVYDLIDRLTEKMLERQRFFMKHREMKKVENVPKEIHMPVIFVILDEFSIMSQAIAESQVYKLRLQNLLAKGRALGIKFLFSSQTFTHGIGGLTATAKDQIQSRIAMKGTREEISETLELSMNLKTDQVKNWMEALPPHYALMKYREGETMQIKRVQVMYFKGDADVAYAPQKQLIERLNRTMKPISEDAYSPAQINTYVDKMPVIVDGNSYEAFPSASAKQLLSEYRKAEKKSVSDEDTLITFGTPRRMYRAKFAVVSPESRENLLLLSSISEQSCGAAVLLSAIRSFQLQHGEVEIWAHAKNRMYRAFYDPIWKNYSIIEGMDDICDTIRDLKQKIQTRTPGRKLILLLGMERICSDFELIDGGGESAAAEKKISFEERKKAREEELRKSGAAAESEEELQKRSDAIAWMKKKKDLRTQAKANGMDDAQIKQFLAAEQKKFFDEVRRKAASQPPLEKQTVLQETAAVQNEESLKEQPQEKKEDIPKGAYNAKLDFQYIVKQGSRLGYHFMLSLNSYADLTQTALKLDLFRHRMAFQISVEHSRLFFGSKIGSVLPEHICQYSDSIDTYSFRPYLHNGLSWDGWFVDEKSGKAINSFDI